jgi:predicted secreted Zn-dependent protease
MASLQTANRVPGIVNRGIASIVCTAVLCSGLSAIAGVSSTTTQRYYSVDGTSKASLARKMRNNPFRGEGGGAIANISPDYSLDVKTSKSGRSCRVSQANLKIRFTLTLPRANEGAMSEGTRAAWRSFVVFAKRHEQQHRAIYLQCAGNFIAKAQSLSGPNCAGLVTKARTLLAAEDRACDRRHAAFDRSERRRLTRQPLFRTAGR